MFKEKLDFYNSTNLKSYNLDSVMRYQLATIERLDPLTRVHSENVANLVCRICEYLKCKKGYIIYATTCGYLHDIGKIHIPTKILKKEDTLTDEEYKIMKTHTTIGYDMCMKDLNLRPYADGPLYHHEALNGTGYPQGLTKKDIPYVAQIIRIADEYDAIVTKRHYTTHINISATLKDLIKDTKPDKKLLALDAAAENYKLGKSNPVVLRALFKVVIDDTYYEISGVMDYIKHLKKQVRRLEQIKKYDEKMKKAKKEKYINYYKEGMKILFAKGEDFDNYNQILEEYKEAIVLRTKVEKDLFNEIKIIKKLRV